jgi:hypothetical protein
MERIIFSLLAFVLFLGFTGGIAQAVVASSHEHTGSPTHFLRVVDTHALQAKLVD